MKKEYITPEVEIISLVSTEVITTDEENPDETMGNQSNPF